MDVKIQLTQDDQIIALNATESLIETEALDLHKLNAPVLDKVKYWTREIWDSIRAGLETAFLTGKAEIEASWQKINDKISEAKKELHSNIHALTTQLRELISQYIDNLVSGYLSKIKDEIQAGDKTLTLKTVDIQNSVKISGSLKSSVESAMSFSSDGEFAIKASYEA